MKILITGASGFVGLNLARNLREACNSKNGIQCGLAITEIYEYDIGSTLAQLETYCAKADFVFHLAGVNKPKDQVGFLEGNVEFTAVLLDMLKKYGNKCPVMFASSSQAFLRGRFANSEYGKSKCAAEQLLLKYSKENGVKVCIYRFPNVFGKWCRPNYNSVVATFCNAIANDLEYHVDDPSIELELLYIDDLMEEMMGALAGREHRCAYDKGGAIPSDTGQYCYVPVVHYETLGNIVKLLQSFRAMPSTRSLPQMPEGSFVKKLYSMYMSYLPEHKMAYTFTSRDDTRGKFVELIKTANCGQLSVNIVKPGVTRGEHWHNSKWEVFIIVSGHGLIQERRIGRNLQTGKPYPVMEFEVAGGQIQAIQILPGYTHNIRNLSEDEDLVAIIWANEVFDPMRPDTFYEPVQVEKI